MTQCELESLAPLYGGLCLCRQDGVVLLKGAIPGEKVLAEIRERKKDYALAEALDILESSVDRVAPRCPLAGSCGGCQYQHILYGRQVAMKEEILVDSLKRIGKMDVVLDETLQGDPWYYRSKAQWKVSPDREVGFYRENSRDVVPCTECFIVCEGINTVLVAIQDKGMPSGIKEITMLRGNNTVALIKGPAMGQKDGAGVLRRCLEDWGLDGARDEYGKVEGEGYCRFTMSIAGIGDLAYEVSPSGFFQSNRPLNARLVEMVIEVAGGVSGKRVLDIYGGAGNFSLPLACLGALVTVIEENPVSIEDAKRNALLNGLKNIRFIAKPFEKVRLEGKTDMAILDPPRRGLSNEAIQNLLHIEPQKVMYISCNPATFARDVAKLVDKGYQVASVRLVDMFPHTYHCETLGVLTRK